MESFLVAGSLTSLALGAAMAAFAWNVIRANQRREAARVELLTSRAFPDDVAPPASTTRTAIESFGTDEFLSEDATDVNRLFSQPEEVSSEQATPVETLFSEPEPSGATARRRNSFAAVAVVVTIVISMYAWLHSVSAPSQPPAVAAAPSTPRELRVELLALEHARTSPSTFVVRGRLRNPGDVGPLRDLVAVVEVFDAAGRVLATLRAPLDRTLLDAGESSAFSVTTPDGSDVAKYRVEFQVNGREQIPHVDLRGA